MRSEELNIILENHKHWRNRDCKNWESMKADLSGANLKKANLQNADLRQADLIGADLYGANLKGANLRAANLWKADLRETNMQNTDLRYANLRVVKLWRADLRASHLEYSSLQEANIESANLRGANLYHADLKWANLCNADLKWADLREAGFYNADLRLADLTYSDLCNADLQHTKINEFTKIFVPMACPDTGSFIAWKTAGGYIIQLEIPANARRSSATGRKCRCDKAKGISIQDKFGKVAELKKARSNYSPDFIYRVGETAFALDFDDCRWNECTDGIHFFITREEAVNYM